MVIKLNHLGGFATNENLSDIENPHSASVGGDLVGVWYTLSLHSNELQFLKVTCLNVISTLVKTAKQSRVFSFWYAFFPGATSSPFKLGIFDLLDHTNEEVRAMIGNLGTWG